MEIPRIYRETRQRVEFSGRITKESDEERELEGQNVFNFGEGFMYFKYPGGEIPILNDVDFANRLAVKGFCEADIKMILELFWSTVATKAPVSLGKVMESVQ